MNIRALDPRRWDAAQWRWMIGIMVISIAIIIVAVIVFNFVPWSKLL